MAMLKTAFLVLALVSIAVLLYCTLNNESGSGIYLDSMKTGQLLDIKNSMTSKTDPFRHTSKSHNFRRIRNSSYVASSKMNSFGLSSNFKRSRNVSSVAFSRLNSFRQSSNSQSSATTESLSNLVETVKKFVFFVGYARSGHSIIGSLMDAHPHVVTANEFFLFSKFPLLDEAPDNMWKQNLFDLLYKKSVKDAENARTNSKKGYTLAVEGQWQGKFDQYIEVIGDKSGGMTAINYIDDKDLFKRNYEKLRQALSLPMRVIHAVRNPFDIISTKYIYTAKRSKANQNLPKAELYATLKNKTLDGSLRTITKKSLRQFAAVAEMIDELFGNENVLEVHNCDLVNDPRATVSRIFQFLGVDASEELLDACAAKIFRTVSRSRDALNWNPELKEMVETGIKKYKMLNRYSFTSD